MNKDLLSESSSMSKISHLYDNGQLTFAKIKDILLAASNATLTSSEKEEGINILLSYSVKEAAVKGAKNLTDIKSGGTSIDAVVKSFNDIENKELKNSLAETLISFERAVRSLSHEEQKQLFGDDVNKFYSCTIVASKTPDIISYDTKSLRVNDSDHKEYDRQSSKFIESDLSKESGTLSDLISKHQKDNADNSHAIEVAAVKRLFSLSEKKQFNTAVNDLDSLISQTNGYILSDNLKLSNDSSINGFLIARVYAIINHIVMKGKIKDFSSNMKMNIAKRVLGNKGISVQDIAKKINKKDIDFVKENFLNDTARREILTTAIKPLEMIISDFSVEMLKSLHSVFTLDGNKDTSKLRSELLKAASEIQNSDNKEKIQVLKTQLMRLRSADKNQSVVNGFQFDYDGKAYKFSEGFAPIGHLLGLLRANQDNAPALNESTAQREGNNMNKDDAVPVSGSGKKIALFPGSFKPPHKGHAEIVRQLVDDHKFDIVYVIISEKAVGSYTRDMSKKVWGEYLKSAGLTDKVVLIDSKNPSPISDAYDFIIDKNKVSEDDNVTIVKSTKTRDIGLEDRLKKSIESVRGEKVKNNVHFFAFDPTVGANDLPLSSTDLRTAIDEYRSKPNNTNKRKIKEYLPDSLKESDDLVEKVLACRDNLSEKLIYDIINECLSKKDKYVLINKNHNEGK